MLGSLLFWIFLVGFAALVFWLIRKNRQLTERRNEEFEEQADRLGWRFARNPQYSTLIQSSDSPYVRNEEEDIAFEIEGNTNGRDWRMWYDTRRRLSTDHPTPFALWTCESVASQDLSILILPRWRYRMESGRVVGAMVSAVTAAADVVGADVHDTRQGFFKRAMEFKEVRPDFAETFVVLLNPGMNAAWLDEVLQATLLRWPKNTAGPRQPGIPLEASLGANGLRLEYSHPPYDVWAFWAQFGGVGTTLLTRLARH